MYFIYRYSYTLIILWVYISNLASEYMQSAYIHVMPECPLFKNARGKLQLPIFL